LFNFKAHNTYALAHSPAGKNMGENLAGCPDLKAGQDVVLPVEKPIKATGHLQILYGNLCPEGSVAKITGKEGLQFTGQVRQGMWQ
jgi:dihydroxy-acid dehydratase